MNKYRNRNQRFDFHISNNTIVFLRFWGIGRLTIEEIAEGTGFTVEELQKELLQPV